MWQDKTFARALCNCEGIDLIWRSTPKLPIAWADGRNNQPNNMTFYQISKRTSHRHRKLTALVALASMLLIGCTNPKSSTPKLTTMPQPNQNTQSIAQVDRQPAQFLPISATAEIGGRTIGLEVTRTPQQQARGLMFRPQLPDDRGMLFNFQPAKSVAFWMKNVPVHLDMIFILDNEVVAIEHSVPPCAKNPCAIYPSTPVLADRVIELRSGLAQELGVAVGDRIEVNHKAAVN
jgi:uncharacterized membrane protein (UPF0127 family)